MMAGLGVGTMARPRGRPNRGRDDATAKIDRILLGKAQLIAKDRGISVAEFLSEILRGPIEKEYGKLLHRFDKQECQK